MTAADTRRAEQVTKTSLPLTRLAKLWAAGTGVALLLVASAYLASRELADPLVVVDGGEVTLDIVTGSTILGATVGGVLAVAIRRLSRRPRLTFLAATLIALAGYTVVPLATAQSIGTAIWLSLFHLIAAIPVIGVLARWLPEDRKSVEA